MGGRITAITRPACGSGQHVAPTDPARRGITGQARAATPLPCSHFHAPKRVSCRRLRGMSTVRCALRAARCVVRTHRSIPANDVLPAHRVSLPHAQRPAATPARPGLTPVHCAWQRPRLLAPL